MGLLNQAVPVYTGELMRVETLPLKLRTFDSFDDAKAKVQAMVEGCRTLANSITADEQFNLATAKEEEIKAFLKALEEEAEPTRKRLQEARDQFFALLHQLDTPLEDVKKQLARERGRYKMWRQEQIDRENERKAREAELERQRKQREADLQALRVELDIAANEADAATARNQPETKNEIQGGIKRLVTLLKSEATAAQIANPVQEATGVRQVVALAIQHEQARIAAAAAKAEGDKKAAAQILRASAKLAPPVVEEVFSERIEAAPIVTRAPELSKQKGESLSATWRVKRITNAAVVPRQFMEVSESLLNDYARRIKTKPMVPGVEFEQEIKMKGGR